MLDGPFESGNIGCAKPELALSLEDVDTSGMLGDKLFHYGGSAVGRIIVDNKDVERVL